ncbi:MAG: hypothetical protein RLZZ385_2698 [Pseudomonadota bacterium]|jgi:predicted alpha/beta-fold hydrolase
MSMIKKSRSADSAFLPKWWLRGGHAQTLYRKFSPITEVRQERQRIELADGDFIDLDWAADSRQLANGQTTIVMLLHGLCGCAASGYMQTLQAHLRQEGLPSVAMNFRGCSGEINRLARAYHSGVSEDVEEVVGNLLREYPQHDFMLVGFSLGANVLLKWLAESAHSARVTRAVAVSTPFRLAECSRAMQRGFSQLYGRYFLRRLVQDMEAKKVSFRSQGRMEQLQRLEELGSLQALGSIWEFDDRVTAPLHGFRNANDYYESCSSIHFLPRITTPTLLIQSSDDPLIPSHALPGAGQLSDHVTAALYERGGHVGFTHQHDPRWLERRIIDFIRR